MTGVSVVTLKDTLEIERAWPSGLDKVLQYWELTCATDANTVAVTSAVSGLKSIVGVYLGTKNTSNVSCAVVQTKAGGAFTVLAKSANTVYAIVFGAKQR